MELRTHAQDTVPTEHSINNKKLLYRTYLYLVSQVHYSISVFVISYALTIQTLQYQNTNTFHTDTMQNTRKKIVTTTNAEIRKHFSRLSKRQFLYNVICQYAQNSSFIIIVICAIIITITVCVYYVGFRSSTVMYRVRK